MKTLLVIREKYFVRCLLSLFINSRLWYHFTDPIRWNY